MTHPDIHSLTGAYATDALDEDERRTFEAHLAGCEACRSEVESLHETTAMLGSAVADPPPAHLRDAVLAEIAETRQEGPAAEPAPRPAPTPAEDRSRRRWMDRLLLPAAAAMAVVLAGMSVVVGNLNRQVDELSVASDVADVVAAADLQTWETPLPEGGTARVMYSPSRGEGVFLADGMDPVDEGRIYELWAIDGDGPSPAGLFDVDDGRAVHAFSGDMAGVEAMAVTVEPDSGSSAPTSDPVVVVELL